MVFGVVADRKDAEMTRDAYVLWILLCAVCGLLGYEQGTAKPAEVKTYYLTGETDPLCGLKGRKI